MTNGDRPAYPVIYDHDDASSEQPGLTKEEYARIELAKAMVQGASDWRIEKLNDVDKRARYLAQLLVGGE